MAQLDRQLEIDISLRRFHAVDLLQQRVDIGRHQDGGHHQGQRHIGVLLPISVEIGRQRNRQQRHGGGQDQVTGSEA